MSSKYGVFLCGDEEPTETFDTEEEAQRYIDREYSDPYYRWMDKRIEIIEEDQQNEQLAVFFDEPRP